MLCVVCVSSYIYIINIYISPYIFLYVCDPVWVAPVSTLQLSCRRSFMDLNFPGIIFSSCSRTSVLLSSSSSLFPPQCFWVEVFFCFNVNQSECRVFCSLTMSSLLLLLLTAGRAPPPGGTTETSAWRWTSFPSVLLHKLSVYPFFFISSFFAFSVSFLLSSFSLLFTLLKCLYFFLSFFSFFLFIILFLLFFFS